MADEVQQAVNQGTEGLLPLTRDQIRSSIFSGKNVKKKIVDFFGTRIEIRQSTLLDIVNAGGEEDRKSAIAGALIRSAYVPGTDQKVFEEGDIDVMMGLPFGGDFLRVNEAITELSEVNFLDKDGGSPKTQAST